MYSAVRSKTRKFIMSMLGFVALFVLLLVIVDSSGYFSFELQKAVGALG